tara:strand:- start:126 stop:452 length:327 start_codon:yes stop_codon:yes gene_type:complete
LTLNQIGYLKNLRIPFVRRAENECLTTTIAAHLTASDATAFYPLVRRFNLFQQETSGCTGRFILRDGISGCYPLDVKALFTFRGNSRVIHDYCTKVPLFCVLSHTWKL